MSKESMLALKEKLLEMQKGMEFLSVKERDYEELQILAEEEAETICELEKENYKLRNALINIENRSNKTEIKQATNRVSILYRYGTLSFTNFWVNIVQFVQFWSQN